MKITIPDLYEVTDLKQIVAVLMDGFLDYPKMMGAFPDKTRRKLALESSLWYYAAYDLYYGNAFSLDSDVKEVVTVLSSEHMNYSAARCQAAGSISGEYLAIEAKMTEEEKQKRDQLYEELDALELTVPLPDSYLYINYLAVASDYQGEGRGKKLMSRICRFADEAKLPLMLFTNTDHAERLYQSLGFQEIKTVVSERFGFANRYLIR